MNKLEMLDKKLDILKEMMNNKDKSIDILKQQQEQNPEIISQELKNDVEKKIIATAQNQSKKIYK